jgi:hypothetical protein
MHEAQERIVRNDGEYRAKVIPETDYPGRMYSVKR